MTNKPPTNDPYMHVDATGSVLQFFPLYIVFSRPLSIHLRGLISTKWCCDVISKYRIMCLQEHVHCSIR